MASNPNREQPSTTAYTVPPGWEKGEPLSVEKLGETCYRLYRSGSYLQLPGAPITKDVQFLEFGSRVEMVSFQAWWAAEGAPYQETPHFHLTPGEFCEVVEELFCLNLREILGNRQGVDKVPPFSMSLHVKDEEIADLLNAAHSRFVRAVHRILKGGPPLEDF